MRAYLQAYLTEKKTFWYCMFCMLVTVILSPVSGDAMYASPGDYPYSRCLLSLLCFLLWWGNALCLSVAPEVRARDFGMLFFGGGAAVLLLLIPLGVFSGAGGTALLIILVMIFMSLQMPLTEGLQYIGCEEKAAAALALLLIALPLLLGAWFTVRCYRKGMARQEQTGTEG